VMTRSVQIGVAAFIVTALILVGQGFALFA
jgi:hypothetical protein